MLDLGQRFDGLVSDSAANSLPAATAGQGLTTEAVAVRADGAAVAAGAGFDAAIFHPSPVPGIDSAGYDLGAAFGADADGWAAPHGFYHDFLAALHIAFA